jgi:hypothetical protein
MTDPLPELAYLYGGEKEEVYSRSWENILSCHGVLWGGINGESSSMYYPVGIERALSPDGVCGELSNPSRLPPPITREVGLPGGRV